MYVYIINMYIPIVTNPTSYLLQLQESKIVYLLPP